MKGYRTYITTALVFITSLSTLLFSFGFIGADLTTEQLTNIEKILTSGVVLLTPLIAYFRSKANK